MLTVTLALCTLVATGANIEQDTTLRMTPHQQKLFQAIHGLDGQSDFINPKLRELQRHHRTPKATMFKKIRELQQHHRQPRAAMLRCSTPATSHMDTSMGRSESPMSALSDDSLALSGTSDDLGSSRFIPLFLNQVFIHHHIDFGLDSASLISCMNRKMISDQWKRNLVDYTNCTKRWQCTQSLPWNR